MFSRIKGNKLKIKKFIEQKDEVIEYYNKFGVVRHVDGNSADTNLVYNALKTEFLPETYLIVGKIYSGKSLCSQMLSGRMSMEIINFNDFLNEQEITKKKTDDEFVINQFLKRQRDKQIHRFFINDFPPSKEFFNIFVKNSRNIRKIFYLNASNNTCVTRMRDLCKKEKSFIGTSQLNQELLQFDKNMELFDFYKKKTNFVEINGNSSTSLVMRDIMRSLQPKILFFSSDNGAKNLKIDLINYFMNERGYEVLNLLNLINDSIQRGNNIGLKLKQYSENIKMIPNCLIIELLKGIIFNEKKNKFIFVNYPRNAEDVSKHLTFNI